jgi:Protein of unknown function (DUF3592)
LDGLLPRRRPARQVGSVRHMDRDTAIALFVPPLLGITCAIAAINGTRFKRRTRSWTATKGIITKSQLGNRSIFIAYEYFTPETRIGWRIGPTWTFVSDPKTYSKRYPEGREVVVYFDPADPSQSCLEPADSSVIKPCSIGAVIFLSFPFLYLLWLQYLK